MLELDQTSRYSLGPNQNAHLYAEVYSLLYVYF